MYKVTNKLFKFDIPWNHGARAPVARSHPVPLGNSSLQYHSWTASKLGGLIGSSLRLLKDPHLLKGLRQYPSVSNSDSVIAGSLNEPARHRGILDFSELQRKLINKLAKKAWFASILVSKKLTSPAFCHLPPCIACLLSWSHLSFVLSQFLSVLFSTFNLVNWSVFLGFFFRLEIYLPNYWPKQMFLNSINSQNHKNKQNIISLIMGHS